MPSPSQAKYGFLSLSSFPAVAAQAAAPAPGTLAEVYRVVLWPNDESLYTDLRNWDRREECNWSDDEVGRVEAGVLVSRISPACCACTVLMRTPSQALTTPPLCLDPDPHVARIANLMLNATAAPSSLPSSHSSRTTLVPLPHASASAPAAEGEAEADEEEQGAERSGALKRRAPGNSTELEEEAAKRRRREEIMRFMVRSREVGKDMGAQGAFRAG